MFIRRISFVIAWALLFLALEASPLQAQTPTNQPTVQLWQITFHDQADLNRLAATLDVWEVNYAEKYLIAPLGPDEAATLSQTHTLILAPDQTPLAPVVVPASQVNGIPGFECYRTVDETFATFDQLVVDYPHLVQIVDIGDSWDKVRDGGPVGDDLRVLVITNQATSGPKFRLFLMGAIHAREYVTSELALRFAEMLLQGYGRDANATWLLDHGELHVLAYANPDGRRIAETGVLWRKNTNTDAACEILHSNSSYGVDLNRNSSFKWAECDGSFCSSDLFCHQTYRGEAPASEPEVQAIEAYLRSLYPDLRDEIANSPAPPTTTGVFISLHSYGRLVLFPWGYTTTHAPNAYGLATLARRFGYPLNYTVCQAGGAGCLYQTDGTTDDFAYGALGVPSFTIEFGTSFFQSCQYFEDNILNQGLQALRYAFTAAPLPYVLAEGPEVVDVEVEPVNIGAEPDHATHASISATVDASRIAPLSGINVFSITEKIEPIRSARLTIDALPWQGVQYSVPLSPVDGAFDNIREVVSATVEMACLPSGRHTLYLQAEDEAGDWGVVAAEFITVTNSSPFSLTVQSDTHHVGAEKNFTVTLLLTNTSPTTAAYTVEATGDVEVSVSPTLPITLTPNEAIQLSVRITPQGFIANKNAADTIISTAIKVRSVDDPTQCREAQMTAEIDAWDYRQRLIFIAKE